MPKRNYATEDDDGPVSNKSSVKRARTADSDIEEEDLPTQSRSRCGKKSKGKGRAHDSDSGDDHDDDHEQDEDGDDDDAIKRQAPEMDEEQLDAQYGAAIRAQLENKKKVQGVSISVAYITLFSQMPDRVLLSTVSSNMSR
jgi:hypothetical protein